MPKYAVHSIVMEQTAARLAEYRVTTPANTLLENRDLAVVGAIGPDIFFWAPDYEICTVLLGVYDAWDTLVGIYNDSIIADIADAIGEIKDAAGDVASAILGPSYDLIMAVVSEFKETAGLFEETLKYGALAAAIGVDNLVADMANTPTAAHSIYNLFKPALQDGKAEHQWYWFDMLHYRHVGTFAGNLLKNASTPQQKAYAYAYMTHIATDLVGHGYVNQIVGGPYRTHVQRHVVMESFLDSWALHNYRNQDICSDLMDYLNLPESLPGGVIDQLHASFIDTYTGKPHPTLMGGDGFLTKTNLEETYMLFSRVTRFLSGKIKNQREPFFRCNAHPEEALRDFSAPPSPPDIFEGDCGVLDFLSFGLTERSRDCYRGAIEAIGELFEYLGELLAWTFESIVQIFQFLLALPMAAAVAVVLGLIYVIQLSLYKILTSLRDYISLSGLVYPSIEMVYTAHGRNLLLPCYCGTTNEFPHTYHSGSCLKCPDTPLELPQTAASWYKMNISGNSASEEQVKQQMRYLLGGFIEDFPLNLDALASYAYAKSPVDTRSIYTSYGGPPGNSRNR